MSTEPQDKAGAKPRARISWLSWFVLVVLVGIVGAVVLPSYGDYLHRSQMSEAVALLGAARAPFTEYRAARKKWPESAGPVLGSTSGRYTQSVAITSGAGGTGAIELTATLRTEGVARRVAGKSVRMFSTDSGKTWSCRAGTAPQNALPLDCRAD